MGLPLERQELSAGQDPDLPGPFPVGEYAAGLREFLRKRPRLMIQGEVTGYRETTRGANIYFELRDANGGVRCAIWRSDLEKLNLPEGTLRDGIELIVAGGPDYYPGSAHSSPAFNFRATWLRLAGEGDLLARLAELRRRLEAEGLFEPQKRLPRPQLPKVIGVVTAEYGAARRDLLAAFERRGWRGTVVWGYAAVQDRHAAPSITRALQDLAARPEVEVIVVCRGGGSLADLWAFCDETLCRTVALLWVPVISAVGHERDSTLIDDVAAVACSTPTHAAEAAVPIDCRVAAADMRAHAATLRRVAEGATAIRARHLSSLARGPARALARERRELNQKIREIRAASERGIAERERYRRRVAGTVLARSASRAIEQIALSRVGLARRAAGLELRGANSLRERRQAIEAASLALRAHDPERTLERGYALVTDEAGEPLSSAAEVRGAGRVRLRMHDGSVGAIVQDGEKDGDGRDS